MTTALVTGAAGFIGSHLAEHCLERGWRVVAVDSLTPYYAKAVKQANASGLAAHPNCRYVEEDLLSLDLPRLLEDVDVVFHLAAQPGVRASWGERFDTYTKSNVTALQRLLEAAKEAELQKFVFASSSSVYGDAETLPTLESCPLRPVSPYGATKALGEHLAYLYWKGFGIPTVTLRYFTVYGPRQRPDMAFHCLISAADTGEEFVLFGDGRQTRDFTYVADTVEGTVAAATRGRPGEVYNLGGGTRSSMNEIIGILQGITGSVRVRRAASARGDARDTAADTALAQAELGFAPSFDLVAGLQEQIQWQLRSSLSLEAVG
jgi:nucleoside-diphosphate-sugar epimerase